jgi:hypothetical protein
MTFAKALARLESRLSPARSITLVVALGAGACLSGTELVSPPYQPPHPITLLFRPDSTDAASAAALGWTRGIPTVQVTLTSLDSAGSVTQVLQGSDSGTLLLDQLQPGHYLVEASRWLTDSERFKLASGDDALGFVARTTFNTATASGQLPVPILASRRHGLVISEWAFNVAAFVGTNTYYYGGFIELYNNADTTVYLDGLTIAQGLVYEYDYPNFPCHATAPLTTDPSGVWTRDIQQFPGNGTDYPVLPGGVVLIAIDAIDHSKIIPAGLDLSHADFEFWGGSADVDNPGVPNMIDTLSIGADLTGHGPVFQSIGSLAVLARPYDLATTQRQHDPSGTEYAKIPADLLLDVVSIWPNYVAPWPRCSALVSSRVDRGSFDGRGYDENVEYFYSVSRRAIRDIFSGHAVLEVTHNSASDFVRTLRSPGTIP